MTSPDEAAWGFADRGDAAQYLRDVIRLWIAWIVGLAVLMTNNGPVLIGGGILVIGLLLWFARPIQRRAESLVPNDEAYDRGSPLLAKGTTRDRALKALAYGEEPLREALLLTDGSRVLLYARRAVIGLTVLSFVVVVVQALGA